MIDRVERECQNCGSLTCNGRTCQMTTNANRDSSRPVPFDDLPIPAECACEFTPDPDEPDEEPWHYLRRCQKCRELRWSLHCPHDGFQNTCACGERFQSTYHEGV